MDDGWFCNVFYFILLYGNHIEIQCGINKGDGERLHHESALGNPGLIIIGFRLSGTHGQGKRIIMIISMREIRREVAGAGGERGGGGGGGGGEEKRELRRLVDVYL